MIYVIFRVKNSSIYIVSMVKRILDSKVPIEPPSDDASFIRP